MTDIEVSLDISDSEIESKRNTIELNGYIIKHDGNSIPIITDKSDILWYHANSIGKHICKFKKPDDAIEKYVGSEYVKKLEDIDCDVDNYDMSSLDTTDQYITEEGVYAMLISSSSANGFKNYITSVLLPELNKNGYFSIEKDDVTSVSSDVTSTYDGICKKKLLEIEKEKIHLQSQIAEQKLMEQRKEKMDTALEILREEDNVFVEKLTRLLERF